MTRVALKECRNYEREGVKSALSHLPELTDFPDVRGKRVLLKPNLLSGSHPEKAVTTHPEIVRGAIELVQNMGAKEVIVGDSPGIGNPQTAASRAGFLSICEETGATWANFIETDTVASPGAKLHKNFLLTTEVKRADVIISLPKLKTHGMMYFTGAMKNLFGLLPGLDKSGFHMRYPHKSDFARMIIDLNLAVKADYAIMDGVVAMEGRGPGNGDPRPMNVILGSSDLLALDIAASNLIGYDGASLPIHQAGLDSPIWINSEDEIDYTGDDRFAFYCEDYKKIALVSEYAGLVPKLSLAFMKDLMVPRPFFNHKECIRCGKCLEICPPDALTFIQKGDQKKQVTIDYKKCIRCYCCDEICPVAAIHLKKRLF